MKTNQDFENQGKRNWVPGVCITISGLAMTISGVSMLIKQGDVGDNILIPIFIVVGGALVCTFGGFVAGSRND